MKEKKNIFSNKRGLIIIVIIMLLLSMIVLFARRNNRTPEETVSKFMHLVENKEYEKANKLCSNKLEKLDILSNIKPSNLVFYFSNDKKKATATVLEDETMCTNINIIMEKTLLGWKIEQYDITEDEINPQVIEDRLMQNASVSDVQLLYWAQSDVSSKEEIKKYAKNNAMVALIFANSMKAQDYNKATELYQPIEEKSLTVEQLKSFNWDNYEIDSNFELIDNFNCITINIEGKKIGIYVSGKNIVDIVNL